MERDNAYYHIRKSIQQYFDGLVKNVGPDSPAIAEAQLWFIDDVMSSAIQAKTDAKIRIYRANRDIEDAK